MNEKGELVEVLPDPRPEDDMPGRRSLGAIFTGWSLPRTRVLR